MADLDIIIGQIEQNTNDRKLKKEFSLSDFIMHVRLVLLLSLKAF